MHHSNKINHYFNVGKDGAGWYDNTYTTIVDMFESDADLFCDILAATSANTSVKGNVTLALKAYQQYKNDKPFTGFLPVVVDMLDIIRINYTTGHHAPYGSLKIQNFARALKGDLSACVVDRWMLRAFGFKLVMTDKRYRDITAWCERKALRESMEVSQVQAAIWCGVKKLTDETGNSMESLEYYLQ